MGMTLWLIRHAAVPGTEGLCYGMSDAPACPQETRLAAQALAPLLPRDAPLWVSGLRRTQQLGEALVQRRPDLGEPRIDERLNEMHFGCWEMRPWSAVPREAVDAWQAHFARHRFGGRESAQEVIQRVASALEGLRQMGLREAVWVTHAGVVRAVKFLQAHGLREIAGTHEWPLDAVPVGQHLEVAL
jgi:alpha-ribazole phosphatase